MPWFKVDDGLTMKVETTRIPRAARTAAIGLLALAGSWSARELTDGHIPAHMLDELCGSDADASWLVTAGYWATVDDGWQFVEWAPDQPLREAVMAERAKKAEKMRDWRSRNQASSSASSTATDAPTSSATSSASAAPVEPAPTQTRPDPDQSKRNVQKPAHDYSEEFEKFWEVYPRKQGKADAHKAYKLARKTTEAKVIRDGAQAYALLNFTADRTFLKLPGGWIRDQRWDDEPIANSDRPAAQQTRTQQNLQTVAYFTAQEQQWQPSLTMVTESQMCPYHPDYPDTLRFPCEACKRTAELPAGAEF